LSIKFNSNNSGSDYFRLSHLADAVNMRNLLLRLALNFFAIAGLSAFFVSERAKSDGIGIAFEDLLIGAI
jgi:hypothetical protein